jgi:Protein of unknown function (DUF1236)/Putative peptidoglycan binding domain
VSLSTEQRTRVQQTIFSRRNVPRIDRVNFAINVGTAVPARVRVVELPIVLIDIYPEWRGRGYSYFVVEEDIVIVDRSRRIVDVVAVGGSGSPRYGTRSNTVLLAWEDLDDAEIREIQLVLIRRGFFRGQADGVFTPRLREALLTFQRREGITARGSLDTRTVTRLGLSERIRVENRDTNRRANTPDRDRGATTRGNERDDNNDRRGLNQRDQEPADRQGANERTRDGDNATRGEGGRNDAREDDNARNPPSQRSEDGSRNTTGQGNRAGDGNVGEREGRSNNNRGNQGRSDGPQRPGAGKDVPR